MDVRARTVGKSCRLWLPQLLIHDAIDEAMLVGWDRWDLCGTEKKAVRNIGSSFTWNLPHSGTQPLPVSSYLGIYVVRSDLSAEEEMSVRLVRSARPPTRQSGRRVPRGILGKYHGTGTTLGPPKLSPLTGGTWPALGATRRPDAPGFVSLTVPCNKFEYTPCL